MTGTNGEPSPEVSPARGGKPPLHSSHTGNHSITPPGAGPMAGGISDCEDTTIPSGASTSDQRTRPEAGAVEKTDTIPEQPSRNSSGVKLLYEGPPKCRCCINWVEQYPDDLRDSAEEKEDTKAKAIVARMRKRHEEGKPLALDSIVVQNEDLKSFLADLFEGYEGITPKLKKLVLRAPFHPFFHRWDSFSKLINRTDEKHSAARPHASLLYDQLRPEIQPLSDEAKDLVDNGVMTYKLLWTIFKPFQRLYENDHSHDRMHIYKDSGYRETSGGNFFQVVAKSIDWDGQRFGYRSTPFSIAEFSGTKPIRDLDIYPFDFHPSPMETRQKLLERGKRFRELCAVEHKSYTGSALVFVEKRGCYTPLDLDERVVLDTSLHSKRFRQAPLTPLDKESFAPELDFKDRKHTEPDDTIYHPGMGIARARMPRDHGMSTNITSTGNHHPLNSGSREPRDEELALCNSRLAAYALTSKKWVFLTDIDGVQPISWNETVFSKLVLPTGHKDLVLSFIEAHISGDVQFDDIIAGKGLGLLMLLAGEPGLGKTLTAEAIAERVQKPLYILSAGELGHDAGDVESSLEEVLEMMAKWNAVLLLDECDVFLEKRNSSRLKQNAIVAIFLRLLEYYKGILIMTTNRADAIDSAFHSRIHLTLRYPSLTAEAKTTIWRQLIQDTKWAPGDTLTDEQYQKLATLGVNGREIKNIVKTGFLLASRNKSPLGFEHLKKVVDATMGETLLQEA